MSSPREEPVAGTAPDVERLLLLTDAALGLTSVLDHLSGAAIRRLSPVARPAVRLALHPPLVPSRWHGPRLASALRSRGARVRLDLSTAGATLLDRLVPLLLEQVLRRVDLTELVVAHLDLDRVVTGVDLDRVVSGVDLDAAVARVDVAAVITRVDLDAVAQGLDVDAVAGRLDAEAVLDRLDLTELVLRRLDLDELVPAILAHVDLAAIAQQVIEAVDLPEIIRESSGAMTSDTVRGARMRGVAGDQAISRVRDRLLPHRDRPRVPAGTNATTDAVAPVPPPAPDRP
jgi:hypothetical protein